MNISTKTAESISKMLKDTIIAKLETYKPETEQMPFHTRLLGKDRYALFSFIQSLNTTFGISVWEQVAVALAAGVGRRAERQYLLKGQIDGSTDNLITTIIHNLREGNVETDKTKETEVIRKSVMPAEPSSKDPDKVVDFMMEVDDRIELFDITSAKPNMKEFVALKTKLLRWTALNYSQEKDREVFTGIAIPYNPYYPKPYDRWTMKGLFDLRNREVMVGKEFWNHVAGGDVFEDLLDIFQKTGEELREIIDQTFSKFRMP